MTFGDALYFDNSLRNPSWYMRSRRYFPDLVRLELIFPNFVKSPWTSLNLCCPRLVHFTVCSLPVYCNKKRRDERFEFQKSIKNLREVYDTSSKDFSVPYSNGVFFGSFPWSKWSLFVLIIFPKLFLLIYRRFLSTAIFVSHFMKRS